MRVTGFIVGLSLLAVGCASTENYEEILQSWVGKHEDQLINAWGVPNGTHTMTSGKKVIEYRDNRTAQMGGYTYTAPQTTYHSGSVYGGGAYGGYSGTSTTYTTQTTPTYNVNLSCKTRFTIGESGYVQKWSWEGNNCAR